MEQEKNQASKSNLLIWQYVILGLILLFGVLDTLIWLFPPEDSLGAIIIGVLLFLSYILLGFIGVILSIVGFIRSKKLQDSKNFKTSLIFLILFIVTPFIIWYINYLITNNFQKHF